MQNEKTIDKIGDVLRPVCEKLNEAERDIAEGRVADAKRSLEMLRAKHNITKK